MEILLEDYKRRFETLNELIGNTGNNGSINDVKKMERLRTKAGCYRTFIVELEREMANIKQSSSNCSIPVVTTRFYYFDCWDRTGELQTKPIKATCEEHATLLFEKEFGETHRYDPPYN